MAGEMGWEELARGNRGEGWVLHHAIADHLGGTVRPFDQYQGPGIYVNGATLWIHGEDGLPQVYNERTEKSSKPFPMYVRQHGGTNPVANVEGAVFAALEVYEFPEGEDALMTLCLHCDHFVEIDEDVEADPKDDASDHLYDGNQQFDHSAIVGYETRTMAYWKTRRPDLFVKYLLADSSSAIGPNAFLYQTVDSNGRDLPKPLKRLRMGQHDNEY